MCIIEDNMLHNERPVACTGTCVLFNHCMGIFDPPLFCPRLHVSFNPNIQFEAVYLLADRLIFLQRQILGAFGDLQLIAY